MLASRSSGLTSSERPFEEADLVLLPSSSLCRARHLLVTLLGQARYLWTRSFEGESFPFLPRTRGMAMKEEEERAGRIELELTFPLLPFASFASVLSDGEEEFTFYIYT